MRIGREREPAFEGQGRDAVHVHLADGRRRAFVRLAGAVRRGRRQTTDRAHGRGEDAEGDGTEADLVGGAGGRCHGSSGEEADGRATRDARVRVHGEVPKFEGPCFPNRRRLIALV